MSISNAARPYARAVFELAQEKDALAEWGDQLKFLGDLVVDKQIEILVNNPRVSKEQLQDVMIDIMLWNKEKERVPNLVVKAKDSPTSMSSKDLTKARRLVLGDWISEQSINLIKLLVCNGRISLLPQIAIAFSEMQSEAENTVAVHVTTTTELTTRQRKQFEETLQTKLGRNIDPLFSVDATLIGGAIVRTGDRVFDGSVRAQLDQLAGALGA